MVFVGRRVPYAPFFSHIALALGVEELESRDRQVLRFFQTGSSSEALEIARRFGATHVCLYDGDRVRFDLNELGVPIYATDALRIYRIDTLQDDCR